MIDGLELLKKDWQKKEEHFPKLTYDEIHKMIWKKSSSIVKWILTISILEFSLPFLLYLIPSFRDNLEIYDKLGSRNFNIGLTIFSYIVAVYFIFQFYKRYKEISVLDDTKNLMQKIIKTRRTVKYYVIYSLSMVLVMVLMMIIGIYLNNDILSSFSELQESAKDISPEKLKIALMIGIGLFGLLMTLLIGGIYFLLYGLLLRRLKRNHQELEQLEI
ncbi:MAG: hypothetical protein QM485_12250 [Flavobacteriaceae bacterium]